MVVQPNPTRRAGTGHIGAFLLIAMGVLMLIGNLAGGQLAGGLVVLGIGLAFAAAYAASRKYGFLVPAGIMSGLGGGILIGQLAGTSDNDLGVYALFGLGSGFLLIYAVDAVVSNTLVRFWPAIPAAVMFVVAGGLAANNETMLRTVGVWSPVVLIVIGIWLLYVRSRAKTN